jgi:hypothetical protein
MRERTKAEWFKEPPMDPKNYSRLAGAIFGIIAVLQLIRVVLAWDITVNGIPVPLFVSGMVAFVGIAMAWLGISTSRR